MIGFLSRLLLSVYVLASLSFSMPSVAQSNARAWGYNEFGLLGDGTTIDRYIAVQPSGLSNVIALSGGAYHSIALKSDGTVWAWGRNNLGQLGDGTTTDRYVPGQVPGLTGVVAIVAGGAHNLAVKSDGTVWTWGHNNRGQLGNGTTIASYNPAPVSGLSNVVAVSAAGVASIVLKADGTVWAWGYNDTGQLGDGTTEDRALPVQVKGPDGVGYLTEIVAIVSCGAHSMALKADGTVWAWGFNNYGQLGDGTTTQRTTPVRVSNLENIVALSGGKGGGFGVALKADGTVWTWGINFVGELGMGTHDNEAHPIPAQVTSLSNILALSCGIAHSLALKSDGTVWAWGSNDFGRLGDGTTIQRDKPVLVSGLTQITSLATGLWHSLALLATRTVSGTVVLEAMADSAKPQIVTFLFRPKDGAPTFTRLVPIGTDGTFRVRDLPPRNYDIFMKGRKWLQKVISVNLTNSDVINVQMTLPAGDANNDNVVDVLDLDALILAFDATPNDAHWNAGVADFNCDGSVDVLDLDILIRNFDRTGDI